MDSDVQLIMDTLAVGTSSRCQTVNISPIIGVRIVLKNPDWLVRDVLITVSPHAVIIQEWNAPKVTQQLGA